MQQRIQPFVRLLISILIVLFSIPCLSACSKDGCRLICVNSYYYLKLEVKETIDAAPGMSIDQCGGGSFWVSPFGIIESIATHPVPICFSSVEEMSADILACNFAENEIQALTKFCTTEDGRIPICNPKTLYAPVFPDTYEKYLIEWYGEQYIAPIYDANSVRKGYFIIVEQAPWEERIIELQNYEQALSSYVGVKHLVAKCNTQDNMSVYWYSKSGDDSTPSYKVCIYSFTQGENTYFVREYYTLDTSETIPANIDIYGTTQDQYFYFYINAPESRPSIDWLAQFGIEKYTHPSS